MSYAGLGQALGPGSAVPPTLTMAPSGPWRPEPIAVAFYGITGLGLLAGGAFARSRGKSWSTAAVYGVAGATIFGGGAVLAVLGRMGH